MLSHRSLERRSHIIRLIVLVVIYRVCIFEPALLEISRLNNHGWRVCVILQHFWWIDPIIDNIKSSLHVQLLILPTGSNGWPEFLVDIEQRQQGVIIDNGVNANQHHVMQLVSRLCQLLISFLRNLKVSLLIPVYVEFARTPLDTVLIRIENLAPQCFLIKIGAGCNNLAD